MTETGGSNQLNGNDRLVFNLFLISDGKHEKEEEEYDDWAKPMREILGSQKYAELNENRLGERERERGDRG